MSEQDTAFKVGYWASIFVAIEVILFAGLLVLDFWVETDMISYIVCFFLAPTFVMMIAGVYFYSDSQNKIWSLIALSFAIMYAVMCTSAYYIQIAVVRTNSLGVSSDAMELFIFKPGSAIFAIDMLGYVFLALSTLVLAPLFKDNKKSKLKKALRVMLIIHGLFFISTLIFPVIGFQESASTSQSSDIFGGLALLFWCVLFVPIPIMFAKLFKQLKE